MLLVTAKKPLALRRGFPPDPHIEGDSLVVSERAND